MDLDPKRHIHKRDGDLRKTYTSDCAFHMVNQSSVVDLRRRVKESHPEGLENFYVDFEQFRPNFVVNTGTAYSEDNFSEMRIGPCLFRTAGPCIRCNAIRTNWNEKVRVAEEEPNRTLKKFRQVDGLGILFGMYYQQEILTETEYSEVCS